MKREIEELGVKKEKMKECLSNVDMKKVNKKVWMMWKGKGDMDKNIDVICKKIEEKMGMRKMFVRRKYRLIVWEYDIE